MKKNKIQLPKNLGHGTPVKINPETKYFRGSHSEVSFSIGIYFTTTYEVIPSVIYIYRTYTEDIIDFLRNEGQLLSEFVEIPSITPEPERIYSEVDYYMLDERSGEGSYKGNFLYKDCVIRLEQTISRKHKQVETAPKLFNMELYYRPGTQPPVEDFDQFLHDEVYNSMIHAIIRDQHGTISFEPFEMEVMEDFCIEKYYKENFKSVHEHIVSSLQKNESGLYLLHGEPGTGKTTYIKFLATLLKRDMIYVPVAFIDSLLEPSFLPALLKKRHSILIIEDAERALLAREPGDSSSVVSAILNITDGLMGNVFNISIIATYNSQRQHIDKALLRKGRLKAEYQFEKLPVEQAQKILDEHEINYQAIEPMTLAEIFNIMEPDNLVTKNMIEEKRVGFGSDKW